MAESFKHKKEKDPAFEKKLPQESYEKNQDGISRRDFLRGMLAVGGAAALEKLLPGKQAEAAFKDITAEELRDPYWDLIYNLRERVLTDDAEEMFLHTKRTGELGKWMSLGRGDQLSVVGNEELLQQELDKNPQAVELLHTHPLKSLPFYQKASVLLDMRPEPDEQQKQLPEKILREGQTFRAIVPPSPVDIDAILTFESTYAKKPIPVTYKIVDPAGVWEYKVNHDHPFVKRLLSMRSKKFSIDETLRRDQEFLHNFGDTQKSGDEIPMETYYAIQEDTAHPELHRTIEDFLDQYKRTVIEYIVLSTQLSQAHNNQMEGLLTAKRESLIRDYIDAIREVGIETRFIPFSELDNIKLKAASTP